MLSHLRKAIVAMAGNEQHHPFAHHLPGTLSRHIAPAGQAPAQGIPSASSQPCLGRDPQQPPGQGVVDGGTHHPPQHGDGSHATQGIRRDRQALPQRTTTPLSIAHRLGSQHEMGEVHHSLVGRDVGTAGSVTEITQVTALHHAPVILPRHPVQAHGRRLVHQLEQRRKSGTKSQAAPAAVTDVEHPLQLFEQPLLVPERGPAPLQRRPERGFIPFRLSFHYSDTPLSDARPLVDYHYIFRTRGCGWESATPLTGDHLEPF